MNLLDRLQLGLVRAVAGVLGLFDVALHTHLSQRLIAWLTARWQARLQALNADLAHLEAERDWLQAQAELLALQAAVYYLGVRCLAHTELRFDPTDPDDEKMLDATLDLLVKPRLATVETQEQAPGRYLYRIEPDWPAIRALLEAALPTANAELADELRQSVAFIDELFLIPR